MRLKPPNDARVEVTSDPMSRLLLICVRAVLWGIIAAVVGSVPATVRLTLQGQTWIVSWVAVSGLVVAP